MRGKFKEKEIQMTTIYSKVILSSLLFTTLATQHGCAPAILAGGATGATLTGAEERGFSGAWDDTKINSQIMWAYGKTQDLVGFVTVVVRQGVVLLTGTVQDPHKKVEAVRLAWTVPGVKEVKDEIKVGEDSLIDCAKDAWITTQLKTRLVFDGDVHSINFNFQTIDQVVYVMGVSRSQAELDTVINVARHINGVREVVNFATVGKKKIPEEHKKTKTK
jgi:osmotically-inducible protein OsmY